MTTREPSEPKQKTCEACGQPFACSGSAASCWCEEVKLGAGIRAGLRTEFSDCLCPNCLAAAARGEPVKKLRPA